MTGFLLGGIVGALIAALIFRNRDTTQFVMGMIFAYAFTLGYGLLAGWPGT